MKFEAFNKIPRLSRDMTITEKLDGTNAQLFIYNRKEAVNALLLDFDKIITEDFFSKYFIYCKDDVYVFVGSRNKWLTCENDNYGFAKWVKENGEELLKLGEGRHYGEWFGKGIQRGYDLDEKRFALFNVNRWHKDEPRLVSVDPKTKVEKYTEKCPDCCHVVPVLYQGLFDTNAIDSVLDELNREGSVAVPNYMDPEGIVIYHKASGQLFKKTVYGDAKPKSIEGA